VPEKRNPRPRFWTANLGHPAYDHLGFHYAADGQFDLAIAAYRKAPLLDPTWESSHQWLGDAYRHQGMSQEALVEYEQAMALDKTSPEFVKALRKAFELKGWKGYWEKILSSQLEKSRHEYVSPSSIAILYARLRDKENAFHYLDKAYANHDGALTNIKTEHDFDLLRADPRYADLFKRMGLPK
jgi:tetratricopeptide (TPR) repeat protein